MPKPYVATGGKPVFREFITPIGLVCHLYHDKPQLKTKDQHGREPDIDPETGLQRAEYKITLAWSKQRMGELQEVINLAHSVQAEAWPESMQPGAFFALEPFFRDGDNPAHNTKNRDYLHGRYYLNLKAKANVARNQLTGAIEYSGAPGLLGPQGPGHVIMPTDIYPGCTARASGVLFGSEYMGRHFISSRLNNIQLYEAGERIGGGGRPTADSQFGALTTPQGGGMGNLTGGFPQQAQTPQGWPQQAQTPQGWPQQAQTPQGWPQQAQQGFGYAPLGFNR